MSSKRTDKIDMGTLERNLNANKESSFIPENIF